MDLRTGTFESTLDDKGRVSVPARIRDLFSGELVITQGRVPSAMVMKPDVWEAFVPRLKDPGIFDAEVREMFSLQIINGAQVIEMDKAGRIAIPAMIRRFAKITKDCLVISADNRLEIWDADFYFSYLDAHNQMLQAGWGKVGSDNLFRVG